MSQLGLFYKGRVRTIRILNSKASSTFSTGAPSNSASSSSDDVFVFASVSGSSSTPGQRGDSTVVLDMLVWEIA